MSMEKRTTGLDQTPQKKPDAMSRIMPPETTVDGSIKIVFTKDKEKKPKRRPREIIEQELKKNDDEVVKLTTPFYERVDTLTETQQELLEEVFCQIGTTDLPQEEIAKTYPTECAIPLEDVFPVAKQLSVLEEKDLALRKERVPYLREERAQKAAEICARIDYDVLFDYYGEIWRNERSPIDMSDNFAGTTQNLYRLREYQYDITQPQSEKLDIDYILSIQNMQAFEHACAQKGFLRAEAESDEDTSSKEFGLPAKEKREKVREDLDASLAQLQNYGELVETYRPKAPKTFEHVDAELIDLKNDILREPQFQLASFAEIDYDPRFIAGAKRYIDKRLLAHRKAGRLPKTAELLAEERQRLDAIDIETAFDHIDFIGFETPEGMKPIFDPQEFIEKAKKILPPDFVQDLSSISYEPNKHADPQDKVVGEFLPIFGEGQDWDKIVSTKIEIYEQPYVPVDTEESQTISMKGLFEETPWHELAHNGHYRLDYDEMRAWEIAEATDPIAITPYVKHCRTIGEKRRKFESFAESQEMFLRAPAILMILSGVRYQYMDGYFKRHLSTEQLKTFEQEQNRKEETTFRMLTIAYPDKSLQEIAEEVRKTMLAHENEGKPKGTTILMDEV